MYDDALPSAARKRKEGRAGGRKGGRKDRKKGRKIVGREKGNKEKHGTSICSG